MKVEFLIFIMIQDFIYKVLYELVCHALTYRLSHSGSHSATVVLILVSNSTI